MSSSQSENRIGFVGAGRMAQALGRGISSGTVSESSQVFFVDPDEDAAARFADICPSAVRCDELARLAEESTIVVLAVKPQVMGTVLESLSPNANARHLFISVAAGVPLRSFQQTLGTQRVIRVMPNTPCLIGQGMSAMSCPDSMADPDRQFARRLLELVGEVIEVQEDQMDAVTSLSGSGPAYVFYMIEALEAGGVSLGLEPRVARQLALQTVRGAGQLASQSSDPPAQLREQVSSPGGTTVAALEVLEQQGFQTSVMKAMAAAATRSRELSSP